MIFMVIQSPLYTGLAQLSKFSEEQEKIQRVLENQTCWSLDEDCAKISGLIHGQLVKAGKEIQEIDAMIAGIALNRHETVLTRNVKDFSRIRTLKVETY